MGRENRASGRRLGTFLGLLKVNPVIPAVREPGVDLERALSGDHAAIFVLGGDVFEVLRMVRKKYRRPSIFINVDTVGGIAADASGIKFLADEVDGIITTHRNVVEAARGTGLVTVQRLFAIDSSAVTRGMRLVRSADPDCVEILPAVAYPEVVAEYAGQIVKPVLAGGLVRDFKTASKIVEAGAVGISTSERVLWKLA